MAEPLSLPRAVNVAAALAKPKPKVDFVLPGLPVGSVATLVGEGGIGKSFLLLQLAMGVATGDRWFDDVLNNEPAGTAKAKPHRVVFFMSEESLDMTVVRLHDLVNAYAGTGTQKKRFVQLLSDNLGLYPMAGQPRILVDGYHEGAHGVEVLSKLSEGARLVIADPLRRFHAGEENSSYDMTNVVEAFERVAVEQRCAVVLAHHSNKVSAMMSSADRASASRGSSALTGGVRLQVNISKLDAVQGGRYGLDEAACERHIRVDVSKANYLADGFRGLLHRGEDGLLTSVDLPAPSTRQASSGAIKATGASRPKRASRV